MKASGLTVTPAETVRSWVHRTVTGLTLPVIARARLSNGDEAETAHAIRVATKQLRSLLRLLRPAVSREAFDNADVHLKVAAGWLAAGRDDSVSRETLTNLAEDTNRDSRRECLMRLGHLLDRQTAPSPDEDPAQTIPLAAGELEKAARCIQELRVPDHAWEEIFTGMMKVYRRARRRMKEAARGASETALHRWRIPIKQLYYQLQWLEPVWPGRFEKMIRRLHRLEDKLGSGHDLSVLKEKLLFPPGGFVEASAASELQRAAKIEGAALRSKCRLLGKKLFRQSTHSFSKKCSRHGETWLKTKRGAPTKKAE